jgi:hypothetical protein
MLPCWHVFGTHAKLARAVNAFEIGEPSQESPHVLNPYEAAKV